MTILETDRLLMRRLVASDLDDLYALYRDPEIRRYFPDGTRTREETREELEWFLNGHPEHPELGLWATIHRESGRFIGRCGLLPWTIEGTYEVEVAYLLDREFWGQGLATEAAAAIVRYGFETLGLARLISLIDAENVASVRVATRVGMKFEKEIVDQYGPCHLYSIARPRPEGKG